MQIKIQVIPPEHKKNMAFTLEVVKHLNRLSGEVVESLSGEMFKT